MKKSIALLLCTALTAGMLVGCGSTAEDTAEAPATEEATDAATEEATDAATDATDAEATDAAEDTTAASDKTWVVATDTVFKPFEYTNSDNEFVGIDVDILAAVAEDQGFKYDLQSLGWDAAVAAVQAGQADAIMAGASIGGSLGSSIGGLIGDNNHGWRGGYRGSAIGNIVGTIAGAAIGNALTAPRQEQIEEDAYIPEVREVRVQKYKKQPQVQPPISQLKLRKIRFIDDNRSHVIDAGENSKIIFEIMNEGRKPVYNVVPVVETVGKVKHLGISPSVMIEEILPGEGIRYTASIHAGERLKDGEVTFRVAVADENGVICDSQEFTLPTQRGN